MAWYSGSMDRKAQHIPPSRSEHPAAASFDELAAQQGVAPVEDLEELLGRPSPDDESAEEFAARLREWRREGVGAGSPQ
jgi:hypothetical protein